MAHVWLFNNRMLVRENHLIWCATSVIWSYWSFWLELDRCNSCLRTWWPSDNSCVSHYNNHPTITPSIWGRLAVEFLYSQEPAAGPCSHAHSWSNRSPAAPCLKMGDISSQFSCNIWCLSMIVSGALFSDKALKENHPMVTGFPPDQSTIALGELTDIDQRWPGGMTITLSRSQYVLGM